MMTSAHICIWERERGGEEERGGWREGGREGGRGCRVNIDREGRVEWGGGGCTIMEWCLELLFLYENTY